MNEELEMTPGHPEDSMEVVKLRIEKEREIQRNIELKLWKLEASPAGQEDDEYIKTSKEKEKAQ